MVINGFHIIKIEDLSGRKCNIYSIASSEKGDTLFEKFIDRYCDIYKEEIDEIVNRLVVMGKAEGARIGYFKENEGKPADHVCALYDLPCRKLRVYCVRIGTSLVILGGGGPKKTGKWQEDDNLSVSARQMISFAAALFEAKDKGDICIDENGIYELIEK